MTAIDHDIALKDDIGRQRLRVWLRLLKVTRAVESELRERLRVEFGTTLPRFDVLAALDRSDRGLKMSELSAALKVSNGNVTGIVDRLVADGLVARVPVDGDRRAMLVLLTGRGKSAFAMMAETHIQWIAGILDDLDAQDCDALLSLLGDFRARKD